MSSSPINVYGANFFSSFENNVYNNGGTSDFNSMFTFARSSTGTYIDENGVIQTSAVDTPRFDYATGRR